MKKILFSLLFICNSVFANPTVFGLTIGETTVEQLKNTYHVSLKGINKYSQGEMYQIPQSQIQFEGISDVTTIFNRSNKLVAVLAELPKSKFDYLNETLAKKYQLVNQKLPFVGNKFVTYRSGDAEITLNAPHMGFQLSMNYIHTDLLKSFNSQSEREQEKKRQQESSML
ncbi:hypothetical protein ACXHQN_16760 [Vibrio cincinnatiensis]|uniref:hypothetical protein n=1 Tax=Vibrio cincinnatiensis TaxID=675 RepID=UPI001EE0DD04|nr:hypothetical protein [Vibrio cincinnatiensis]MCG3727728.1 hypothetical protein [Vibrio cincinnatiensis]